MKDALANVLLPADAKDDVVFRVGSITGTSPIEVSLGGVDGLSAAYLDSYTPIVDDVVLVLQNKNDLIVLGLIQPGG